MAWLVRITGFDKQTGAARLSMEAPWWPAAELREDSRFRESVADGYLDYEAALSVDETRALHERFRGAARRGSFDGDAWQAILRPMIEELDAALGPRATEFAGFTVQVMEWESGLG